jgi:hypothetical protein
MKTTLPVGAFPPKDRKYLTKSYVRRTTKYIKRATNKAFRKLAKLDPENAPKHRRYRGWEV